MFTLPSIQKGQPALTLARLSVGFVLPDPSRVPVIAVLSDPKEKDILGMSTCEPQSFLYVVEKMFPGALQNPPVLPGRIPGAEFQPGEKLTHEQLLRIMRNVLSSVTAVISGMIVSEDVSGAAPDDETPAGVGTVVSLEIDDSFHLKLNMVDAENNSFDQTPGEIA